MIEALVVRESDEEGFYIVIPTVGTSTVKAIDIHRVGFAPKEKVTIIQIGEEYGIAKKTAMLPSVVRIPYGSRKSVAAANPAQFFCAYIATQLGRISRLYETGIVQSANELNVLVSTKRATIRLGVATSCGIRPSEFIAGEEVIIKKTTVGSWLAGWWSSQSYEPTADYEALGFFNFSFSLRDKAGVIIEEELSSVYVEFGIYDWTGEITGSSGGFLDLAARRKAYNYSSYDFTYDPSIYSEENVTPNNFRITYFYGGEWLTKNFLMDKSYFSLNPGATGRAGNNSEQSPLGLNSASIYQEFGSSNLTLKDFDVSTGLSLAIEPGPHFTYKDRDPQSYDFSYMYLNSLAFSVSKDGVWSFSQPHQGPGPFFSLSGTIKKQAPVTRQFVDENWIVTLTGFETSVTGTASYDGWEDVETNVVNRTGYIVLTHQIGPKEYLPTITVRPPWMDEDLPESITVIGAGTEGVNGMYILADVENKIYLKDGYAFGWAFNGWVFFNMELEQFLYSSPLGGDTAPVKEGYLVLDGTAPAPTVAY